MMIPPRRGPLKIVARHFLEVPVLTDRGNNKARCVENTQRALCFSKKECSVLLNVAAAAVAHGACEVFQQHYGVVPAKACIGYRLTVDQRLAEINFLIAFNEIGLDHDANDVVASAGDLFADVVHDVDLLAALLARIGVGCVDHHHFPVAGSFEDFAGFCHALSIIVGLFSAAQNHVAVLVASGGNDGRDASLGDRQE